MNFRKVYLSCRSNKERASVVSEWLVARINELGLMSKMCGSSPAKMQKRIKEVDLEARTSFNLDIVDGWRLHKDWFRCAFCQFSVNRDNQILYNQLNWGNVEQYVNPAYCSETTIEYLGVRTNDGIAQVKLLLVSTGAFPQGSNWQNSKSGLIWQVVEVDEINGRVEFEWINDVPKYIPNVFVTKRKVDTSWKRIKQ